MPVVLEKVRQHPPRVVMHLLFGEVVPAEDRARQPIAALNESDQEKIVQVELGESAVETVSDSTNVGRLVPHK